MMTSAPAPTPAPAMDFQRVVQWCTALVLRHRVLSHWLSHPVDRQDMCHNFQVLFRMIGRCDIHLILAPGYIEIFGPDAMELRIPRNRQILGADHERLLDMFDQNATSLFRISRFLPSGGSRIHRGFVGDKELDARVPRLSILRALCAHFLVGSERHGLLFVALTLVRIAIRGLLTHPSPGDKIPQSDLYNLYSELASASTVQAVIRRCVNLGIRPDSNMPCCVQCGLPQFWAARSGGAILTGEHVSEVAQGLHDSFRARNPTRNPVAHEYCVEDWECFIWAFAQNVLDMKHASNSARLSPVEWEMVISAVNRPRDSGPSQDPVRGPVDIAHRTTEEGEVMVISRVVENPSLAWPTTVPISEMPWGAPVTLLDLGQGERARLFVGGGWLCCGGPDRILVSEADLIRNACMVLERHEKLVLHGPQFIMFPITSALWWMIEFGDLCALTRILHRWAFGKELQRMVPPRCQDRVNWIRLLEWLCCDHMPQQCDQFDNNDGGGIPWDVMAWIILKNFINPAMHFYEKHPGTADMLGEKPRPIENIDDWWEDRLAFSMECDMVSSFYNVCERHEGQREHFHVPSWSKAFGVDKAVMTNKTARTRGKKALKRFWDSVDEDGYLQSENYCKHVPNTTGPSATPAAFNGFPTHPLWKAFCVAERARWTWRHPKSDAEAMLRILRAEPVPPVPQATWDSRTLVLALGKNGALIHWRDVILLSRDTVPKPLPTITTQYLMDGTLCQCVGPALGPLPKDPRALSERRRLTHFQ